MNKLSELSKPVAWFTDDHLTDKSATTYSEEMAQRWRDKPWFVGNLYSQEYVSALLADNEKKEKLLISNAVEYEMSTIDLLAELEAKDKRIAELERANKAQDDHINQQQDRIDSLEKTNTGLGQRLGAAEKRLSTPVRLPSKNDDEFWFDGVFQVAKFDRAVERAISAVGFTFTVEGDE